MQEPTYIPDRWDDRTLIQVRDGELMLFRQPPKREDKDPEELEKQRAIMREARIGTERIPGQYSGSMTPGSRKRMTKAVTLMCQTIKPRWILNEVSGRMVYHRLSFCTLTVAASKILTAREAYKQLLSHFLAWLRRTKGVKLYIWKAELQQRGQIHYHVIFPDFIHYKEIRAKWNQLQREAGLLDNYVRKHKHADPNSTDIHEMHNVRKTAKYVVKELGKDIDANKLKIYKEIKEELKAGLITREDAESMIDDLNQDKFFTEGKVWDCSDNLAGMSYFTMPLTVRQDLLIREWLANKSDVALFGDWWAVVDLTTNSPPAILNTAEKKHFENHLQIIERGGRKYLKEIALFLN